MSLKVSQPPPHGGRLVNAVVDREEGAKMAAGCPAYDIRPTIDPRTGVPIRNAYREVMSIAYGFFSPLDGFMTRNEVESVMRDRRLLSGWLFPFPIIFDVDGEELRRLGVKEGDRLLLRLKGRPFAIIDVEEVWRFDPRDVADRTFGTPERNPEAVRRRFDEKHPGWLIYRSMTGTAVGGRVHVINEPRLKEPYDRFWYPPSASRLEFGRRGWRTVIAHQTRNVPHTGHEHLMKEAAFLGDIEPCNGILVNAIIGAKRLGDFVDEAILEGHEAINKFGYIRPERHLVTMTLWDMRYGNPLESLLHGIIRQNMGCTHHMFGRDHAAVGDYYDPYATQTLWSKGIPSYGLPAPPYDVDRGLKIRPVNIQEFWYCPVCGEIAYSESCGHRDRAERFSGSFVRGLIAEGIEPPPMIFRPEVYQVIVKWWRKFNYPFVNKRYLEAKEAELEVELDPMEVTTR
ncbi:sulfate adenylyltransferase [Thermocladium modestius]|uniref:sulfate adenylyltransferase n=1 Tax=Thermocladium modestius TaxID=62609 RepID=A0A830GWA7_9CREN|nr:sulfate adenylyltransferase [Thermocladium modestius]GGP22079.1 sulfate adenylyltransferase [Thermocladium modestius]